MSLEIPGFYCTERAIDRALESIYENKMCWMLLEVSSVHKDFLYGLEVYKRQAAWVHPLLRGVSRARRQSW